MSVYVPRFEPQHDEGLKPPLTNCNPASASMLIDWYTYGAIDTSDVRLRQASGIPPDRGMNFAAVDVAIRRLYGKELGGLLYSEADGSGNRNWIWRQLLDHLDRGGGAVVCGYYGDLPEHFRRWSPKFTGGHAAYVQGLGPEVPRRWFDPLAAGDATYEGEPISDETIWRFIWTAGSQDASRNWVTAAHGFLNPRPEPSRFVDVPRSDPYYTAVEALARARITAGIGRGLFGRNRGITRAEAAAWLARFAKATGLELPDFDNPKEETTP